jgi:signal transduction histidine kinase/CheY-like chemotaxis protein
VGPFWTRWWFFLTIAGGSTLFALAGLRFAYARRYAQTLEREVRRRTEELESSQRELLRAERVRSLGVLAGGIAHDFNNVLTHLMGSLSLLRADAARGSALDGHLDEADHALDRARQLAGQLLTFSKGGVPVTRSVPLEQLVRDTASFVLSGSSLRCDYDFPAELWAVEVDVAQVHQVFENLFLNARQAMPDGGSIRVHGRNVRAEEVERPRLTPGRYVGVTVSDDGPGIPEDELERVFEPFYTTKSAGSGLGLATARSVLERHGGAIVADSAPSGVTFRLYLPAASDAAERPSSDEAVRPGDGRRVLVVDDEEPIRRVLLRMLTRIGYEAETVPDSGAALEALLRARGEGKPFTTVILDLTIPGDLDSRTILARLRDEEPALSAIASSGYADDPILARHVEFGFSAALPKPYRLTELARVLQEVG